MQQVNTNLDMKAHRFLSMIREEHCNCNGPISSNDTVVHTRQNKINNNSHVDHCNNAGNDLNRSSSELVSSLAPKSFNEKPSFSFTNLLKQNQQMERTGSSSVIPQRCKSLQVTFGTVKIQQYERDEETNTTLNGESGVQESLLTIDEFESCRTSSRTGNCKKRRRGSQVKVGMAVTRKHARPSKNTTLRDRRKRHKPVGYILNKLQLFLNEGSDKNDTQSSTTTG